MVDGSCHQSREDENPAGGVDRRSRAHEHGGYGRRVRAHTGHAVPDAARHRQPQKSPMLVFLPGRPDACANRGSAETRVRPHDRLRVIAAAHVAGRRERARGGGHGDIGWLVAGPSPAGALGARGSRLTDCKPYTLVPGVPRRRGRRTDILRGIAAGGLAGLCLAGRRNLPVRPFLDAVEPAVPPLAQAIGRRSTRFNQELFGRLFPLPWAARIDLVHRPASLEAFATVQPTFRTNRCETWPSLGRCS